MQLGELLLVRLALHLLALAHHAGSLPGLSVDRRIVREPPRSPISLGQVLTKLGDSAEDSTAPSCRHAAWASGRAARRAVQQQDASDLLDRLGIVLQRVR